MLPIFLVAAQSSDCIKGMGTMFTDGTALHGSSLTNYALEENLFVLLDTLALAPIHSEKKQHWKKNGMLETSRVNVP